MTTTMTHFALWSSFGLRVLRLVFIYSTHDRELTANT